MLLSLASRRTGATDRQGTIQIHPQITDGLLQSHNLTPKLRIGLLIPDQLRLGKASIHNLQPQLPNSLFILQNIGSKLHDILLLPGEFQLEL
jgi:hypothetical protein